MENVFEIKSGRMVVSDPAYDIPTWCHVILDKVKNGKWVAEVDKRDTNGWGERIWSLSARHTDVSINMKQLIKKEINGELGVDSGQLGFFDYDFYRNDEIAKDLPKEEFGDDYDKESGDSWYRSVCRLTLSDESWGVLSGGVVSSSGIGDGCYEGYILTDKNGEIVSVEVTFIDEDEEDEEDICQECGNELNGGECDTCEDWITKD